MPSKSVAAVRHATGADAPGILRCLAVAFAPFRDRYPAPAFADTVLTPDTLAARFTHMRIFVATDAAGGVVGTIACGVEGDDGHLRGMAVDPAWQGSGVAAQLLDAAESDLRGRGVRRVTLGTTRVLVSAIAFYERHGFRPSGRISDHFGIPLLEYVKPPS